MAILTNKEYLLKSLSRFNVIEDDVDVIILESGLDPDSEPNVAACKRAMYDSLSVILPTANISESGYSVSWNMEAIRLWYDSLCKELGLPNTVKPAIRNRSNLW